MLVIFSNILGAIKVASKYLQSEKADLSIAAHHLEAVLQVTTNYRNKFAEAKQEAIDVAELWSFGVK